MSGSLAAKSTPLDKRVSKKVKLGSRGGSTDANSITAEEKPQLPAGA
jgi:hypothetical protein